MTLNDLAKAMGDASYGFLAINGLWGAFCVILVWRRIQQLRFRHDRIQAEFLEDVQNKIAAGQLDEAAAMCEGDVRALPQLVHVALTNRDLGYNKLRQYVAERFQQDVLADLEYRISWIVTVIKSGPLLGLFGTVLGMMAAFGKIGSGEKVEPSQIAAEISIALICTAMGLMTAIPLNYLNSSINIRLRKLQDQVGTGLMRFFESLRPTMI